MKYFVVLRVGYNKYPPRPAKKILEFGRLSGNNWAYVLQDQDGARNHNGFAAVFEREDAARRDFENSKGMDGENSSVSLIFVRSFTKSGAAKKAIGELLWLEGAESGEVIDSYSHKSANS